MQHTIEQIGAAFAALVTLCGIIATLLPQQWSITKLLTKIGALTFRAQVTQASKEIQKP